MSMCNTFRFEFHPMILVLRRLHPRLRVRQRSSLVAIFTSTIGRVSPSTIMYLRHLTMPLSDATWKIARRRHPRTGKIPASARAASNDKSIRSSSRTMSIGRCRPSRPRVATQQILSRPVRVCQACAKYVSNGIHSPKRIVPVSTQRNIIWVRCQLDNYLHCAALLPYVFKNYSIRRRSSPPTRTNKSRH